MNQSLRCVCLSLTSLAVIAATAGAQTLPAAPQPSAVQEVKGPSRPAATTFLGDTGLWFVPIAEVLPTGKGSGSGYRRGTNFIQGYTNVGDLAGTFAIGLGGRAEVFGSLLADTRVNRDLAPLFNANPAVGGFIDRYPLVNSSWTGNRLGDFFVGAKVNLMSEARKAPVALAVRGVVKVPTGNMNDGVSTGKTDVAFDFIASKDAGRMIDLSGYGGYEYRGSPDGFQIPTGAFRWGGGAAYPSHSRIRGFGEINGSLPSSDIASTTTPAVSLNGLLAPLTSNTENLTRLTAGATVEAGRGFFMGVGLSWNGPALQRDPANAARNPNGDYWDWQVRIGFHPGVREYAAPATPPSPPPPPPPPAPRAAAPAVNLSPTVDVRCDPCTVEIGQTASLSADARDPDGDSLTYRWSAPSGTVAEPRERRTLWTAPTQPGSVALDVSVDDGRGGTASGSVTVNVIKSDPKTYTFEDILFEFDRSTLRPEGLGILDQLIAGLQNDATLKVTIDGYTCNIGTAEYNLALGGRRADAVRDYLVSRGIAAGRLRTISYGEEHAKFDNSTEATRKLNRRAALVVSVAQ